MKKILTRALIVVVTLGCLTFLFFKLSPYPSVWIIRNEFDKEAIKVNKELQKFVPDNILAIPNVPYDVNDTDAFLDAYFHKDSVKLKTKLPVIVWTHGGGLISGDKNQLSNYCKILASYGYVVVAIDYSIAPEKKYPTPMRQLNKALAYISANSGKFHADKSFFVLAGDSGGSMVSAATANIITNPKYAQMTGVQPGIEPNQLRALLLYCGIYEIDNLNEEGSFGSFLKTVKWAYFGKKDISNDHYAKTASITNYLTSSFPITFISAGNNDPLLPQSLLLSKKLSALQVPMDTLFYAKNHYPALGHEYQFTLDSAGKIALKRSIDFLKKVENNNHQQ
ncbi:alpha/beta hydrolase [Flavobacterium sp.]|uniref:alpha/beta hydrolase n=1 Tax=Flavobacterium sp. TaxID=239 RepID=UPI002FDE3CCC